MSREPRFGESKSARDPWRKLPTPATGLEMPRMRGTQYVRPDMNHSFNAQASDQTAYQTSHDLGYKPRPPDEDRMDLAFFGRVYRGEPLDEDELQHKTIQRPAWGLMGSGSGRDEPAGIDRDDSRKWAGIEKSDWAKWTGIGKRDSGKRAGMDKGDMGTWRGVAPHKLNDSPRGSGGYPSGSAAGKQKLYRGFDKDSDSSEGDDMDPRSSNRPTTSHQSGFLSGRRFDTALQMPQFSSMSCIAHFLNTDNTSLQYLLSILMEVHIFCMS